MIFDTADITALIHFALYFIYKLVTCIMFPYVRFSTGVQYGFKRIQSLFENVRGRIWSAFFSSCREGEMLHVAC